MNGKIALPDKLAIYFNGICEPVNPGGWATYGWFIMTQEGKEIQIGKGVAATPCNENSTNNYAQWCALGFALCWLFDQHWKGNLQIYGNSKLVIEQLSNRWNCNSLKLVELRNRCWYLLEQMGNNFVSTWIPQEKNERCNVLSREALAEVTGKFLG
jgi:ribonuclease HI